MLDELLFHNNDTDVEANSQYITQQEHMSSFDRIA